MVVTLFLSLGTGEYLIPEDDPFFTSADPPEAWLLFVTFETVTAPRPPSPFPSLPPFAKLVEMLEDPPPADLNPAAEPPEAAELPLPELTAPIVVMLTAPVPCPALDPLALWELLDVIRTELLVLLEPPDAAFPPDPTTLRERPRGNKLKSMKKGEDLPTCNEESHNFITFFI